MNKLVASALVAFFSVTLAFGGSARTSDRSLGSATCASYTANPDNDIFQAYLSGYIDASNADPRYVLSPEAQAAEVRRVADWCVAHPRDRFLTAVGISLGQASGPSNTVIVPVAAPTSCRVGPSNFCSGCATTCAAGSQATCKQGQDSADGKTCAFDAQCGCK